MSQGHPAYPQRNAFATSSKLPDRTFSSAGTATQPQFARSAYSRRPEYAPGPGAQSAPQYGQPRQTSMEKEQDIYSSLPDDQRDEIQEAFTLFDLDNDKYLSFQEMRVAFRALGFKIPRPELKQMLEAHGTVSPAVMERHRQKGGTEPEHYHVSSLLISQAAFVRIAAQRVAARDPLEEVERAFNLFDQDRKGYIVFEDLRRVAHELGETGLEDEELHAMINEFDFDGTGSVARETFYSILMQ
ncbi:uncharacterized protein HMPREF1541_02369 [Cyphellophora europaea CBS 101466]|uniref:EF-hand domain-containing protein n=1 Tax=Cyphellophora europaea (strain CBS 101466) TaxID=1220924 RepID=W2S3M8_CYPE1|nr:uncharacterized protein HMPREF1541_02369 [Cyphellophora europaea CBS 101466]ETN43210.1 hypothetical protein HMPREF1541_02369 [Cyphellophora europaea CBS 101466]